MQDPPIELAAQIARNLQDVLDRAAAAHQRAGRTDSLPRLVAVTKYVPVPWIEILSEQGMRLFGESRPQQLNERAEQLAATISDPDLQWHFIGTLQRNKVRQVLPWASLIHSVDSVRLLDHLQRVAQEMQMQPAILLQINVSGETSKHGFSPDELLSLLPRLSAYSHLQIQGLMTMAPDTDQELQIRSVFSGLRALRDQCQAELARLSSHSVALTELSMGMSGDFEIAVEEGATLIRLGSILFTGCEPAE
jgi:pyridoxal phosphate enzyme (YggS family)